MKKFEKKILQFFFVQDVAWDLQKCILEVFLKNLYTILNASYFVVENFERSDPFYFLQATVVTYCQVRFEIEFSTFSVKL